MADALQDLIMDREKRVQMGAAAREHAMGFSMSRHIDRVLELAASI